MSGYRELLDATIAQLESMQAEGFRFIAVRRDTLAELAPRPIEPRVAAPARVLATSPAAVLAFPPVQSPPAPAVLKPIPAHVAARWNQPAAAPRATEPPRAPAATAPVPPPPRLDPVAKIAAMEDLRGRALACVKCPHLVTARKSVVFGVGDVNARLVFVGEAPGADEDRQGEPFVGLAGELLTRIITAMNLSRGQVFIANILKCRPDTPGQSSGNRKPTTDEMATCLPWLHEQINLIQPEVLVALGGTAVEGLLGKTAGITRLRGQWQTYRGIPLMPTYHPAFLLRSQSSADKRKVWEDMLAVMERLTLPISTKQRGFFLPKA